MELDPRDAAISALAAHIGVEPAWTLHQRLPAERWEDVVPESFWQREDVAALRKDADLASLRNKLTDLIGEEHTATILALLPPLPWRELAARGVVLRSQGSPDATAGP